MVACSWTASTDHAAGGTSCTGMSCTPPLYVEASCTVSDVLVENNWFGHGVTVESGADETSSTQQQL